MAKLFLCIFILTLLMLSAVAFAKVASDCSITLKTDIKGIVPVILTAAKGQRYQLFKPTGLVTSVETGTQLLLACTGKKNVFADTSSDIIKLTCLEGNFIDSNNNVQNLSQLSCKSIPSSSLQITTYQCSHGKGFIYESGFVVDNQFYGPVFEICYDNRTEQTFYTHHTLNGAAIKHSISESTRRPFTADGMNLSTAKTNNFYKKNNQISRFKELFGSDQTYVDEKNFLARGHLAPDADFILPYEKLSTYYYANVAPQFQAVNAGNWLRVEELARATAASYKDDIESYNSYMGVLALPNKYGHPMEIYLDDIKQFEAPQYYFKVLLHRASNSAIVFVSVNNPYMYEGAQVEICATNVCKEAGFEHANFPDVRKGYTFCCELNEFKLLVDTLPDEVKARKLLKSKKLKKSEN